MDRNEKFLKKLSQEDFDVIASVLSLIQKGNTSTLHIKKLTGYNEVYRVRVGKIRIIFYAQNERIEILEISRRSEKTYKNF